MAREVTERDFRKPEFIDADPKDYEFRDDGVVVRKDRWERGIRSIWCALNGGTTPRGGGDFEIQDVVDGVYDVIKKQSNQSDSGYMSIDELYDYIRQLELDNGNWKFGCSAKLADNSVLHNAHISGYKDASILFFWHMNGQDFTISGIQDVTSMIQSVCVINSY